MGGRPQLAVEFQPGFTHKPTQPGVILQAKPTCAQPCAVKGYLFLHGGNGKDVAVGTR